MSATIPRKALPTRIVSCPEVKRVVSCSGAKATRTPQETVREWINICGYCQILSLTVYSFFGSVFPLIPRSRDEALLGKSLAPRHATGSCWTITVYRYELGSGKPSVPRKQEKRPTQSIGDFFSCTMLWRICPTLVLRLCGVLASIRPAHKRLMILAGSSITDTVAMISSPNRHFPARRAPN